MAARTFLWRIEIRVPSGAVGDFQYTLEPYCMAVSAFAETDDPDDFWLIEGFIGAEPDRKTITQALNKTARGLGQEAPKPKIQLLPPRDWLAENLADFPANRIGRYFIHGSHFEGRLPAALMALDRLAKAIPVRRPLDMGCGSGILSLAMAKTWKVPVIACDIDAEAVRVTTMNARLNGVGRLVRARTGPGYKTPIVAGGGPYDLICANILARPLCRLAGDAAGALARHGLIVLSGLLVRDSSLVLARHRAHGFKLVRAFVLDGWQTLVMKC